MDRFDSRDAMEFCEKTKRGCMGVVEVICQVDEPGSADHGQIVSYSHNTITLDARGIMARAIAGFPNAKIAAIHWGSGQRAPAREDAALQDFKIATPVESAIYPTDDSVMFSATIPAGKGAEFGEGVTFSEVGLVSGWDNKLFARYTFPPQPKFERLKLSVNWQIFFV